VRSKSCGCRSNWVVRWVSAGVYNLVKSRLSFEHFWREPPYSRNSLLYSGYAELEKGTRKARLRACENIYTLVIYSPASITQPHHYTTKNQSNNHTTAECGAGTGRRTSQRCDSRCHGECGWFTGRKTKRGICVSLAALSERLFGLRFRRYPRRVGRSIFTLPFGGFANWGLWGERRRGAWWGG
jgi:hypothetical protein